MSQEELLLKDLCARQPYGVKVLYEGQVKEIQYIEPLYNEVKLLDPSINYTVPISNIKPYLRPMSSMTEEEYNELEVLAYGCDYVLYTSCFPVKCNAKFKTYNLKVIDWLNAHHFDYRGLIEKNLALDCTGLHIYD